MFTLPYHGLSDLRMMLVKKKLKVHFLGLRAQAKFFI